MVCCIRGIKLHTVERILGKGNCPPLTTSAVAIGLVLTVLRIINIQTRHYRYKVKL